MNSFDMGGLVYQYYVVMGSTINAEYFVTVMRSFLKVLKKKRPTKIENGWIFHMANSPSCTAALTMEFVSAKGIRTVTHPPYNPDLAPTDFLFFFRAKEKQSSQALA